MATTTLTSALTHSVFIAAISLASACGGSSASPSAPAPAPAPAPTPEGAAGSSAETSQVDQGAALYGQYCASCHGADGKGSEQAPAVVGPDALPQQPREGAARDVEFTTAGDVFRWVRVAMPGDAPGSLQDEQYAAILAFALHANGVDMSGITLDEAQADQMRLH